MSKVLDKINRYLNEDRIREHGMIYKKEFILAMTKINVPGWTFDHQIDRSGTFEWESSDGKYVVYATPHWEGMEGIPFNVMDAKSGDDLPQYNKTIKYTYDLKKTPAENALLYIKAIEPELKKLPRRK